MSNKRHQPTGREWSRDSKPQRREKEGQTGILSMHDTSSGYIQCCGTLLHPKSNILYKYTDHGRISMLGRNQENSSFNRVQYQESLSLLLMVLHQVPSVHVTSPQTLQIQPPQLVLPDQEFGLHLSPPQSSHISNRALSMYQEYSHSASAYPQYHSSA